MTGQGIIISPDATPVTIYRCFFIQRVSTWQLNGVEYPSWEAMQEEMERQRAEWACEDAEAQQKEKP